MGHEVGYTDRCHALRYIQLTAGFQPGLGRDFRLESQRSGDFPVNITASEARRLDCTSDGWCGGSYTKSLTLLPQESWTLSHPKKVENLAYELKLPSSMKMHSVVSVIHLKHVKKNNFERENT